MPERFRPVLDALEGLGLEPPPRPVILSPEKRCANWQRRYDAALAGAARCLEVGAIHYACETLEYAAWLIRRRPFRGHPSLDFFKPYNPEA